MVIEDILKKAEAGECISVEEARKLWDSAPLARLMQAAHARRMELHPEPIVTWQIDRNVNITNCCISGCRFCNFHCTPTQSDKIFITTIEEYSRKIEEMKRLGGDQLLLQGGLHPKFDVAWYETLFKELKRRYPEVKLHALGPPEVDYIARRSSLSVEQTLERLRLAGLDSLPGAGAEILDNEVRKRISPGKCSADRWCEVMHIAHTMGFATSATMMYGHIETIDQRLVHLEKVRTLQSQVPDGMPGFLAFIPWIFRSTGTRLETEDGVTTRFSSVEYLRLIAISRLMLNNIPNIQASWLTVGAQTAQLSLWGGANDMGSIMIEENVVSSAGAHNQFDANGMKAAIRQAGFTPRLRDQKYNLREEI